MQIEGKPKRRKKIASNSQTFSSFSFLLCWNPQNDFITFQQKKNHYQSNLLQKLATVIKLFRFIEWSIRVEERQGPTTAPEVEEKSKEWNGNSDITSHAKEMSEANKAVKWMYQANEGHKDN